MNSKLLVLLIGICFHFNIMEAKDYTRYVDPYIGAGGHGHVFVGASVPFGAIQVGPQNIHKGWDWCSGYHYSDSIIIGFAHTHLNGTGCTDMGDVQVMPFMGKVRTKRGEQNDISDSYASYYRHENETVRPNYYSLRMDNGIKAELSATERVAIHHYRFPGQNEEKHIMINLKEGNGFEDYASGLKKIDDYTVEGYRFVKGWSPDHRVFFVLKTDKPIKDLLLFEDNTPVDSKDLNSKGVKGVLVLDNALSDISLKVAISSVGCRNAALNMEEEIPHWNLKKVCEEGQKKWNKELGRIKLSDKDEANQKIFYTALYHTLIAPTLYCDVNGEYRGHDHEIHKAENGVNYSTFSLWDTYRALHPLFTITQTERVGDFINSMLSIYDQQGKLPVWPLFGGETDQTPGYNSLNVIADAYLKNIKGFDAQRAFQACVQSAVYPKQKGIPYVLEQEYIPCERLGEATSIAMEYAIGDWGVAAMAQKMGDKKTFDLFLKRSKYYKHYFDPDIKFVRPKKEDGTWVTPYNPLISVHGGQGYFSEGTGWQYSFYAPQCPSDLINLYGGDKPFLQKLDSLFTIQGDMGEHASIDITGLIGQYAHGNEPSHHMVYLYSYAGEQWKTAEKVRYILKNFYTDQVDGIIGNEDCGQMSAWYLLSAMGFYQVNPSWGVYAFGSPLFKKVTIELADNKKFTIETENNSDENIYICAIELNGKPYSKTYIQHEDIMKGGTLKFIMGKEPNYQLGAAPETRPYTPF
ncbi:GH92 family glycosyl hydrolase [Bacteroides sp.]